MDEGAGLVAPTGGQAPLFDELVDHAVSLYTRTRTEAACDVSRREVIILRPREWDAIADELRTVCPELNLSLLLRVFTGVDVRRGTDA
jgi:hypothetical protein